MANTDNSKNVFANAKNMSELDMEFEVMTSPENLYADGERTRTEANRLYKALRSDYRQRASQIQMEYINHARSAETITDVPF